MAIVGSSNLSSSALGAGVEWNYRVISSHDQPGYQEALQAFGRLFGHPATTEITVPWIDAYRRRRRQRPEPAAEALIEPPEPPPTPNVVQQEALQQLEESRARGNRAGLVVLATGLGKTWLSAFDSNRPEFRRILFVAHREEILDQALRTFRRIRPEAHLGFYTGGERTETADILFASVQTLSRVQHLHRFAPDHFDYIVVDEFHHADARTYRRLIDYFEPRFLLGLTATPERTDGGDLLVLCQENLIYRCDILEGIKRNLLSPFHYFGVTVFWAWPHVRVVNQESIHNHSAFAHIEKQKEGRIVPGKMTLHKAMEAVLLECPNHTATFRRARCYVRECLDAICRVVDHVSRAVDFACPTVPDGVGI